MGVPAFLDFLARDVSTRGDLAFLELLVRGTFLNNGETQNLNLTMCESGDDLAFLELLVRGWKTGRGNPVVEFNLDNSGFHVSRNTGLTPSFLFRIGNWKR